MAAPKRTKIQREYDLDEIANLYLQGWIQAKIVDHIAKNRPYELTQATVSRDLKAIQERWLASSIRSFDEAKAQELAKIDHLENIAWGQFYASQKMIVRQKTSKKVGGKTTEAMQEVSKGYGDIRFLDKVSWCIDRRCKLLGLDAPNRNELTGKDGGPIETLNLGDLTDDQLKQLAGGKDILEILSTEE